MISRHDFRVGGYPSEIKPGEQFVFFVDGSQTALKGIDDTRKVVEMWPVNKDIVTTSAEGNLPAADVAARADKELPKAP